MLHWSFRRGKKPIRVYYNDRGVPRALEYINTRKDFSSFIFYRSEYHLTQPTRLLGELAKIVEYSAKLSRTIVLLFIETLCRVL